MRLIMAFLVSCQASASTILIQGPGTSPLEYRAALKADPDAISPSRNALKQKPAATSREKLLKLFAEAQKSFLEKSDEEAAAKFAQVTAMATADDWDLSDRNILMHAYLRLAQLIPARTDTLLKQAAACGDDAQAESELFPPPLLEKLAAARAAVPRSAPPFGWVMTLVNGFPCGPGCAGIPLTGEKVRLTFLSDTWQSVTQIMDPRQLPSAQVAQVALASGHCAASQSSLPGAKVFWGLDCEPAAKPLNFQPVVKNSELPKFEIREQGTKFYKSKWFWGGVVLAAAAALAINGQKRQKQEREPTTTYGYQ